MWSLMWLPLAVNLVLAATGPTLARALHPRVGVRLLPGAMLVVASGTGVVLASLGFLALAQIPAVAAMGNWSPIALRATQLGPVPVEVTAGVAMLLLLASALRQTLHAGRLLVRADATCRRCGAHTHGLVVVEDDVPDAYALPTLPRHIPGHPPGGINGRIVVSTAMLRALSADERRVVLAHEAAHLAGHHHLYVQLAELAAAANPLLRPTARAVRLSIEREADEAAAAEVGDRRLAARALARAALAKAETSKQRRVARVALAATDGFVAQRATALLSPAPRPRRLLAAGLVLLAAVTLMGTAAAANRTDDSLDAAERPVTATALAALPALAG
jgi:Zn-dependent protease with chaperone function